MKIKSFFHLASIIFLLAFFSFFVSQKESVKCYALGSFYDQRCFKEEKVYGYEYEIEALNKTLGGWVRSSPAIMNNEIIVVGSDNGNVYALELIKDDGFFDDRLVKVDSFQTGGWVRSSPAIMNNGTIVVGSDDKNVYALGLTEKKLIKTYQKQVTCKEEAK